MFYEVKKKLAELTEESKGAKKVRNIALDNIPMLEAKNQFFEAKRDGLKWELEENLADVCNKKRKKMNGFQFW